MYRTTQVEGALGCPKQLWISLLFWTEGEPILKLRCPFLRWNSISKDKAGKRTAENVFSRNHGGVVAQIAKEKILNLIDDIVLYAKRQNMTTSFHITGGDPILSKNFWEVLEAIKAKYHNIPITIMGNSYHVTETSIREMKKRGVLQYQISLDGLESTHDMIRKKGSFEDGIRALSIIHEQGLVAAVMFTVSRRNYKISRTTN